MFVLIVLLLPSAVFALDVTQRQSEMLQTEKLLDALPKESRGRIGEITPHEGAEFGKTAMRILQSALQDHVHLLSGILRTSGKLLGILVICAMVSAAAGPKVQPAVDLAAVAVLLVCCTDDMSGSIHMAAETVEELSVFSKSLLPVAAAAAAASGSTQASAALYGGSVLFLSLLTSVISKLFLPLLRAFLALSAADCVLEGNVLTGLRQMIMTFMKNALRFGLLFFSGYLSLSGVIAGSADALAVKAAKMSVSAAVPVVGGMISDASETVLVSAKILVNSVGVFGMLGVFSILIVPFLKVGLHYLGISVVSSLSAVLGCTKQTRFLEAVAQSMGVLTAITCSCGLFVFVACVCFLRITSI